MWTSGFRLDISIYDLTVNHISFAKTLHKLNKISTLFSNFFLDVYSIENYVKI